MDSGRRVKAANTDGDGYREKSQNKSKFYRFPDTNPDL